MQKWILWMVVFAGPLFGQGVTGAWQGTLEASRRMVIKISAGISASGADSLSALVYNVDQGGVPVAASSVALRGSALSVSVPGIGGTYEGKLSADGASIAGTWTQDGRGRTLNLVRATSETAWAIPSPPDPVTPMAGSADPVFEVATIKPSGPDARGKTMRVAGRRFITAGTTLNDLITFAYGIHRTQVVGGPAWLETDKYDVVGDPNGTGQPSTDQLKAMVRKLLADRFKLALHRDKKELSVYTIGVGQGGPKLTASQEDPNGLPGFSMGRGLLRVRNTSVADLGGLMLVVVLDRPIVDQTGLTGRYDFTLKWTPDEFQFGGSDGKAAAPTDDAPDLFTAMQKQLGLKLESTKAAAEVFAVDHVERPSEN